MEKDKKTPIPRKNYIDIVKFTLGCMLELARTESEYNLILDTAYYYKTTIETENVLTKTEFEELCKEMGVPCILPN